ncbi:hypothetical protein J2S53_002764 [Actinopolyspora lacussalsi]|nr:hypothetical protein [Actinopolyspora lacussalsi]
MTAPTDPHGGVDHRAPSAPTAPPRSVWWARWLWITAALVGLGNTLLRLADREMLIGELRRVNPELSQREVDAAANGGIMFALLFMAGLTLLYVFFGNRMARGANWARVLVMVLCGLYVGGRLFAWFVISMARSLLDPRLMPDMAVGPLTVLFTTVIAALNIAVFVLLLRGESRRFFAGTGVPRSG